MKILAVISLGSTQLYDGDVNDHDGYYPDYRGLVDGRLCDIEIHGDVLRLVLKTNNGTSYLYVDLIQKGD